MVRIAYIVPPFHNLGDKIVWLGARHEYRERYGEVEEQMVWLDQKPPRVEADILAVVGTPWLWDICHRSGKYDFLREVLRNAKCGTKEAIGIGANYPLIWLQRAHLLFQHTTQCDIMASVWGSFDVVRVRDRVAKLFFDVVGVKSVLARCPAYSAAKALGVDGRTRGDNILVFYDLMTGTGADSKAFTPAMAAAWNCLQREAHDQYDVKKVICVTEAEVLAASRMGFEAKLFKENDPYSTEHGKVVDFLQTLAMAGTVVSGRVHAAVPAVSLGRRVVVLPVDSRHLTVWDTPTYYDENPMARRWYEA